MTKFEQLTQITTLQEAVEFLKEAVGPDGIEGAELCIICTDHKPDCHRSCEKSIYESYLLQEI